MMQRKFPSRVTRRGSVLVLALAVLIVLTSLALVLARSMRTEAAASANYLAQIQSQAVAQGAVEYLRAALDGANGQLPADSNFYTQAVRVGPGYFWLLKHDHTNANTYAFGLTDEAGKLNLNTATLDMLAALPNMTTDLAANIVAWRSSGSAATGGAQSQYYLLLPTPYQAKNAPLETVEELLLVKDITPQILYGNDTNRNGVFDANDSDSTGLPNSRSLQIDRGLVDYVTVYSAEPNTDSTGKTRVNVNTAGRNQLRTVLQTAISGDRLNTVLANIFPPPPSSRLVFRNVIDFYYRAGLQPDEFRKIADGLTASAARTLIGLVNLNTAPREVLVCLPGLTDADADAIVAHQQSSTTGFATLADLIDVIPQAQAVGIGSQITVRSYQCAADIIAVDATGRSFKRYQTVFDTRTSPVKVLYWRDLTSLGWPLDKQILADLRDGRTLETGVSTSASPMNQTGGH